MPQVATAVLAIGLILAVGAPPLIEADLRFRPDADDRGLDTLAAQVPPDSVVLPIFVEDRWPELRDMLIWELHWRRGAVLLPVRRELSPLIDFEGVDVVITQTALDPAKDRPLVEAGFRAGGSVCLWSAEGCPLQLWRR